MNIDVEKLRTDWEQEMKSHKVEDQNIIGLHLEMSHHVNNYVNAKKRTNKEVLGKLEELKVEYDVTEDFLDRLEELEFDLKGIKVGINTFSYLKVLLEDLVRLGNNKVDETTYDETFQAIFTKYKK